MSQNHIFSARDIAYNAMFGALLFVIYMFFSQILYIEFVTTTVLLYASTFKRKNAITTTVIFALLVNLIYGIQPWSFMYLLIWPTYAYLIAKVKHRLTSIVRFTIAGFLMSLFVGTLIDLPYFLILTKEVSIAYLLLGLKTSFVSASITAASILVVFEPLHKFLKTHKLEEL